VQQVQASETERSGPAGILRRQQYRRSGTLPAQFGVPEVPVSSVTLATVKREANFTVKQKKQLYKRKILYGITTV
jgi:hypothetical protein